jgi:hypothetical protein
VINGPIEGLILAMSYFIVSAVKGPEFWLRTLRDVTGVAWLPDTQLNICVVTVQVVFTIAVALPMFVLPQSVCRSRSHRIGWRAASRPWPSTPIRRIAALSRW